MLPKVDRELGRRGGLKCGRVRAAPLGEQYYSWVHCSVKAVKERVPKSHGAALGACQNLCVMRGERKGLGYLQSSPLQRVSAVSTGYLELPPRPPSRLADTG